VWGVWGVWGVCVCVCPCHSSMLSNVPYGVGLSSNPGHVCGCMMWFVAVFDVYYVWLKLSLVEPVLACLCVEWVAPAFGCSRALRGEVRSRSVPIFSLHALCMECVV